MKLIKNNKKWIYLIVLVELLMFLACTATDKESKQSMELKDSQVEQTLIAMENAAFERFRQGDPDGRLEMIPEEYTFFDPYIGVRLDNYEGMKENYDELRGLVYFDSFDLIDPVVQVDDDIAVLTFNFKSFGKLSDSTSGERSHWNTTEVFQKFDKDWKLISTHWSFTIRQLTKLVEMGALYGDPAPVKSVSIKAPTGKQEESILETEKTILDNWIKGGLSGFNKLLTDDCTFFGPGVNKRIDGIEEFKKYRDPVWSKIKINRYEIINPRIQMGSNMAVLTYNLDTYSENGDNADPNSKWNCTEIYRKINNEWKLISSHWSYNFSMIVDLTESGAFNSTEK